MPPTALVDGSWLNIAEGQTKIHWQFSNDGARTKLKRLYPIIEPTEDLARSAEA